MSTIHLDALIASIRDDMAPIAEQKDIIITASASPAQIDGMEDAIRLMITNLTDNAIRYTPQQWTHRAFKLDRKWAFGCPRKRQRPGHCSR